MTALAATNVTVTIPARDRDIVPAGPKNISLATIAFGNGSLTYPTGGVPMPANGVFGFKKEIQRMFIDAPADGYIYKYDATNRKIKMFSAGQASLEEAALAAGYDVAHAAIPGGNAVYLKFDTGGRPYLCCNMANDTADKVLAFGDDHNVVITHDASAASGGLQVYVKESSGELLVNNTLTGADVYIAADVAGVFLKATHDADANTNGVEVKYDDDTAEELQAVFAGEADVEMALTTQQASSGSVLSEVAASVAPAAVSLNVMLVGE